MTGKIKEARVRAARFLTETPNRVLKSGAVGIEDKIDFKFKARERRRHAVRVLERMRERASVRIIRRANDERDLLRSRFGAVGNKDSRKADQDQQAHHDDRHPGYVCPQTDLMSVRQSALRPGAYPAQKRR